MAITIFPIPNPLLSFSWLVTHEENEVYYHQSFFNLTQGHYDLIKILELLNKKICSSSDQGWLVLPDLVD